MITDRGALLIVGLLIFVIGALFTYHMCRQLREADSRANPNSADLARKENQHVR